MPSSHTYQINEIMELVILTDPKSILDVGVGFGKYGVLCYERLNLWYTDDYKNKRVIIDGIEGFPGYITPIHNYTYDNIYLDEVFQAFKNLKCKYDLILLIDVLEHFKKDKGRELIFKCLAHGKNLIVSTPHMSGEQGNAFGNELEIHHSQWYSSDFNEFNAVIIPNRFSCIVYIGEKAQIIANHSYYLRRGP